MVTVMMYINYIKVYGDDDMKTTVMMMVARITMMMGMITNVMKLLVISDDDHGYEVDYIKADANGKDNDDVKSDAEVSLVKITRDDNRDT